MKEEVLIAGFGGQGILLMGRVLAEAALRQGLHTTWFPSYGPEMRGGTANCTTIWSDEEIGAPICGTYTVVIAMNQPSLERFAPRVRPGGLLLINRTMVPVQAERHDVAVVYVPAGELARTAGNERVANVVMVGALLALRPELETSGVCDTIRDVVGAKHAELVGTNIRALQAGREYGEQALAAGAAPVTTTAPVAEDGSCPQT
jgi:2-oxoglutarate ferredoxin oxidoreductase subunit gamma